MPCHYYNGNIYIIQPLFYIFCNFPELPHKIERDRVFLVFHRNHKRLPRRKLFAVFIQGAGVRRAFRFDLDRNDVGLLLHDKINLGGVRGPPIERRFAVEDAILATIFGMDFAEVGAIFGMNFAGVAARFGVFFIKSPFLTV